MNLNYKPNYLSILRGVLLISSIIFISSCSPDDEDDNNGGGGGGGNNNSPNYFMNATINGQSYQTNLVSMFGFSNQDGCLPVNYHLDNIGQIDVANYFFDAYIFRYENDQDLAGINTGTGGAIQMFNYFYTPEGDNSCNFRMVADLRDKQQSDEGTTLLPSGTHTVTSITEVSQNSTEVTYAVEGSFSCSFINDAGQQINITGTYRIPIECLL